MTCICREVILTFFPLKIEVIQIIIIIIIVMILAPWTTLKLFTANFCKPRGPQHT